MSSDGRPDRWDFSQIRLPTPVRKHVRRGRRRVILQESCVYTLVVTVGFVSGTLLRPVRHPGWWYAAVLVGLLTVVLGGIYIFDWRRRLR